MEKKHKQLIGVVIGLGGVLLMLYGYKIANREHAFVRELRESRENLIHVEPYEGDYIAFCYNKKEDAMKVLRIEETLLGYDAIYTGIQREAAVVIEKFGVAGFYFPALDEGKSAVYVGMLGDEKVDMVRMIRIDEEDIGYEVATITTGTGGRVIVLPMKDFDRGRIEVKARD